MTLFHLLLKVFYFQTFILYFALFSIRSTLLLFTLKILSHPLSEVNLWATIIIVLVPLSFKIDSIIFNSVELSSAEVASSKARVLGWKEELAEESEE